MADEFVIRERQSQEATGNPAIVVLVTAPSREEAEKIARLLVEAKLAACVNVVDSVTSIFRWAGDVSVASESLLIIKTQQARFPSLIEAVKKHHAYSVPEIIALPIVCGEASYLDWIRESTGG